METTDEQRSVFQAKEVSVECSVGCSYMLTSARTPRASRRAEGGTTRTTWSKHSNTGGTLPVWCVPVHEVHTGIYTIQNTRDESLITCFRLISLKSVLLRRGLRPTRLYPLMGGVDHC